MTETATLEPPETAQEPQEDHAEEATEKPARKQDRVLSRSQSDRLRIKAFARAWATPGPTHCNATKSAELAGYSPATAASQGSRLLKRPKVWELIDAITAETAAKLTAENAVTVDYVKSEHLRQMAICERRADRTNAREHLEDLGRMVGAYDTSLHLDLTVKHEYDAALEEQAHILARVLLEKMGDEVLGLPSGESKVIQVKVEGVRPSECSLVASGDAGGASGGEREADHDGHPREEG